MKSAARWAKRGTLILLALGLLGWGLGEARQWTMRMRAQRLLNDIRAIQVNRSPWPQAQRLMTRWGRWGDYAGTCTTDSCRYFIGFDNLPDSWSPRSQYWAHIRSAVGLQSFGVFAGFRVRHGLIVEKYYSVEFRAPVKTPGYGWWLDGMTIVSGEGPRLSSTEFEDPTHPNRDVRNLPRATLGAFFTPTEDEEERKKLIDFDLRCFTSFRPCASPQQVLPEAFLEAQQNPRKPCKSPLWTVARDQSAVFVAGVIAAEHPVYDDKVEPEEWELHLQVKEILKGNLPGSVDGTFWLPLSTSAITWGSVGSVKSFPYKSVILAGDSNSAENSAMMGPFDLENPCGLREATPANLAEARKGVALDFAPAEEVHSNTFVVSPK